MDFLKTTQKSFIGRINNFLLLFEWINQVQVRNTILGVNGSLWNYINFFFKQLTKDSRLIKKFL